MYLEKVLGGAYPELYRQILPDHCSRFNLDVRTVDVPIIWMDALSLREALLLSRDLDADCELPFRYSRLPSETVFYKEAIFHPWNVKYVEADTKADKLIDAGYIVPYDGYYLVGTRYAWATRGKYKVMLHGGVSLLECLVPVLRVAF